MHKRSDRRSIATLLCVYRWLLRLYPADFRQNYGQELLEVTTDMLHDASRHGGRRALAGSALHILADLLWTAGTEQVAFARTKGGPGMRRGFDVLVALALLIVLAPLCVLIALLIKLDSPGPVFYRDERLGLNGHPFRMLKFRTMTLGPAPRAVTRVGHMLRRWCLDEVPQLWHVLTGEMDLIGPRPQQMSRADTIYRGMEQVLRTRPGLTGPAVKCQLEFPVAHDGGRQHV